MNQSLGASFNIIQLAGEIFGSLPPKPQFSSIKKTRKHHFPGISAFYGTVFRPFGGTSWEKNLPKASERPGSHEAMELHGFLHGLKVGHLCHGPAALCRALPDSFRIMKSI